MKRWHIWQVNIGLWAAVVLLLLNALVLYQNMVRLAHNKRQVSQSYSRLLLLEQIVSTVKDAETGQRGYLLTGRESYLEPYQTATRNIQQQLRQLQAWAIVDTVEQQQLRELERAIALKLAELQETIQLRRTEGLNSALVVVQSDRGQRVMNQILQATATAQTLENQQLAEHRQEFQASQNTTLLTFTLVSGVSLGLLGLVSWLHHRNFTLQQHATRQLQASEQLFSSTFNQAAVGMAHVGLDGSWQLVNQKLCEIVGYSAEELSTKTFQDITYSDDLATDLGYVQQVLNGEIQTYSLEKRYINKHGSLIWVNLTVSLLRDETGQPQNFISVVEDISDRKATELKLCDRENLLNLLVKYAPVEILMLDREMRYLLVTEEALNTYPFPSKDMEGRSHYATFPNQPPHWRDIHQRGLNGAIEHCAEEQVDWGNGVVQWVSWELRPWYTVNQDVGGIILFTKDITQRKQMEESLSQSEEQLRRVLQEMPVMLDAFDENFNPIIWNQECERVTGFTAAEVIGNPAILEQLYPDSDYRDQMIQAWAERGNNYRNWEWEMTCKNGSTRTISWSNISDLFAIPGWATWGIGVDVTERKQAEDALWQLNATLEQRVADRTTQLEEVNQELQAFTYSVSHDLRAPLRIMQGFAQALQEDYGDRLDELAHRYIASITESAIQMDGLINDLLEYSRLTRAQIELVDTDLNLVVAATLQQLQAQIKETGAQIAIAPHLPTVVAHPPTLVQVLANLLSNAIKFVAPGITPNVTIESSCVEKLILLSIKDNGIGIDPTHQNRIFRVFERLHGVETYPGTGIGLAIAEKGIERMNGRIGVESQPGEGSRFWIALPPACPS